jgi:hypothetical protein
VKIGSAATSLSPWRPLALALALAFAVVAMAWPFLFADDRRVELWPIQGILAGSASLAVGSLVLLRADWHRMGWLLVAIGLAFVIASCGFPGFPIAYDGWRSEWAWTALIALMAGLTLRFPSGGIEVGQGWPRRLAATANYVLVFAVVSTTTAVALAFVTREPVREGTFSSLPAVLAEVGFDAAFVVLLGGIASLVIRLRGSSGELRAQLAWVVSALAVPALLIAIAFMLWLIEGDIDSESIMRIFDVLVVTYMGVPVAIGVAILRYRLYDIDRIMSRTLSYALLTAGLGVTYLFLVVALQALLRPLNGGHDFAIVATTLLVAVLFLPARRRVQAAVDRRFNRRHYNAERTVDEFAARLRQEVDLDSLRDELLTVVGETMQPAKASLWLKVPASSLSHVGSPVAIPPSPGEKLP